MSRELLCEPGPRGGADIISEKSRLTRKFILGREFGHSHQGASAGPGRFGEADSNARFVDVTDSPL